MCTDERSAAAASAMIPSDLVVIVASVLIRDRWTTRDGVFGVGGALIRGFVGDFDRDTLG
jgi:hypothetical protein